MPDDAETPKRRGRQPKAEKTEPDEPESPLLQITGIGPTTLEKLTEAGYDDLMMIAVASPGEIAEEAGIGMGAAQKIIEGARKAANVEGFRSATDLLEERKSKKRLKIGVASLDDLIGGGFEPGAITEAFGEFGSGKTQIGHQLAVNVTLPENEGGLNGECAWLDSEGMFVPERIRQMAEAKKLDSGSIMSKIHVARAFNSQHQEIQVDKISEISKEHQIRLIVVDSLTAHFRAEYPGRGELAGRQQKLNTHIHSLLKIGSRIGAVIYVTNQVMASPGAMWGDPTRPIGGHILGHASAYRLYLRKSKAPKRIARLVDSPSLPEGEAVFSVTEEGITE